MSFLQSGITLKALLEDPSLLAAPKQDGDKGKKSDGKTSDDLFSGSSAFLGPTLWDKSETLPYTDFQLEYMDLDEFLTENGIEDQLEAAASSGIIKKPASPQSIPPASPSQSSHDSSPASLPVSPVILQKPQSPTREPQPAPAASPAQSELDSEDSDVQVDYVLPSSDVILASIPESQNITLRSPVSPEHGEREDFSNSDIILSTIPGQEMFDPRRKRFTDDELRPQPMIKKSKKVFVPDDCKDDKYWARRKKNNMAAKRSRDARRVKENQIALRASFLEKENNTLKEELAKFKKENKELKQKLVDLTGHS